MDLRLSYITLTPTENGWYLEAAAHTDDGSAETSFVIEDAKESQIDMFRIIQMLKKNPEAVTWYTYSGASTIDTNKEN